MPEIHPKPKASKFVVFTYCWQVFAVAWSVFSVAVGVFYFVTGNGRWGLAILWLGCGGMWFTLGILWRSIHRDQVSARASIADVYRRLGSNK